MIRTLLFSVLLLAGCAAPQAKLLTAEKTIETGLRFCESTLPYDGGILIANFGTEELNPLNQEKKGYITFYKNDSLSTMVAPGELSAPKGMCVVDSLLFVADVQRLFVFTLGDTVCKRSELLFPEGNPYVNDIAYDGINRLYVTVTNSGKLYSIDLTRDSLVVEPYCDIAGANGIVIDGNTIYVASYPPDGTVKEENYIYKIADKSRPEPVKLSSNAASYDGLALSADRKKLYFTAWEENMVGVIDLASGKQEILSTSTELIGPADISISGGELYVPYLGSSKVVKYSLPE